MATTTTATATTETDSKNNAGGYSLLKTKIKKLEKDMGKLKKKGSEDSEEYRDLQGEQKKYFKQLYKTREYKAKKLKLALANLHGSSVEDSSSSSSDDDDHDDEIDRGLIQKKYDELTNLLLQLESDHGKDTASTRKDYETYVDEQQKHFETLAKDHPEWVQEEQVLKARRNVEAEAARVVQEQERLVDEAKAADLAKLEAQKQAIRDKIRKECAERNGIERMKEQAYELDKKVEDDAARKNMQSMYDEATKRGDEYVDMLHVQEDMGMIRLL
jgi:hypothetical protein